MRRAIILFAVGALGALGCGAQRTEVVLSVSAPGLVLGTDIDGLHIVVTDTTAAAQALADRPVPLCGTGNDAPTCKQLPVTATLIPGPSGTNDPVRVLVEGTLHGTPVISDAAVFTFVPGESGELDFVLYPNCKGNVSCALQDKVCDINGNCSSISPIPLGSDLSGTPPPDLSTGDMAVGGDLAGSHDLASHDLAGADLRPPPPDLHQPPPPDMARPHDLAGPHDLLPPPLDLRPPPPMDMTSCGQPGQVCCTGMMCNPGVMGNHCISNTCTVCGTPTTNCCPGPFFPCGPNLACNGLNQCVMCGQQNEPCCPIPPNSFPACQGLLSCNVHDNMCEIPDGGITINNDGGGTAGCGMAPGDPCCQPGNLCMPTLTCNGAVCCQGSNCG